MRSRKTPTPSTGSRPSLYSATPRASRPRDSRRDADATAARAPPPPAARATSALLHRNGRREGRRPSPEPPFHTAPTSTFPELRHLGRLPALLVHVGLDHLGRQARRQFAVLAAFEQDRDNNVRIAPGRESHEPAVLIESFVVLRASARTASDTTCADPVLPAISTPGTCADGAVPSGSSTRAIASVMRLNPSGSIGMFVTSM